MILKHISECSSILDDLDLFIVGHHSIDLAAIIDFSEVFLSVIVQLGFFTRLLKWLDRLFCLGLKFDLLLRLLFPVECILNSSLKHQVVLTDIFFLANRDLVTLVVEH